MAILETTFVIDFFKNKENIEMIYLELEKQEHALFLAAPTVMELWNGALMSKWPDKEKQKIKEFIHQINILPLDMSASIKAAELNQLLTHKGSIIQLSDIMIAAIAIVNGEKVVTRDSDYTRIPGLIVLKY